MTKAEYLQQFAVLEPATVAGVLKDAPSLRVAVYRLKTSETRLRKVCRASPELAELFTATKARGLKKAASARRMFRFGT